MLGNHIILNENKKNTFKTLRLKYGCWKVNIYINDYCKKLSEIKVSENMEMKTIYKN